MLRALVPYFQWSPWGGGIDDGSDAEANGRSLMIVWLGLAVEICFGLVRKEGPR